MEHTFDLTEFINTNFKGSRAITFANANIEVRKSAQVRIKNLKDKQYYEITAKHLSSPGDINLEDSDLKDKANIGPLENQTLRVGDILFTMRTRFGKVKIITKDMLAHGLPVVAAKGITIIRVGDVDKAKLIKYYLDLPEIQKYINNDKSGVLPTGKISIGPEVINELLIPAVLTEDQPLFIEYSNYLDSISDKSSEIAELMKKLCDMSKSIPCKKGIKDTSSYDYATFKELENELDKALRPLMILKGNYE